MSFGENCLEDLRRAPPPEMEPQEAGGSGGGGGGEGGGGEDTEEDTSAAGTVDDLLAAANGSDVSWKHAAYPPNLSDIFTPQDLATFSFGRPPTKYCTVGERGAGMAKSLAHGLHAIMLAASGCYEWLLPIRGTPRTYTKELSNVVVNNMCLPLCDASLFVEILYPHLPLYVAICPHGHKGLVPAAKPNVTPGYVDFSKEFCGLHPHQRPYSVPFFSAIFDALGFEGLLNLNVLPNGRADWDLDGLGDRVCAGARAVVFFWLYMLLAFGVDHALVVTAKVRRLILHVAMCVCDKVAVRKHRYSRERSDGSIQEMDVLCMYLQLHGVSAAHAPPFPPSPPPSPPPPPPRLPSRSPPPRAPAPTLCGSAASRSRWRTTWPLWAPTTTRT